MKRKNIFGKQNYDFKKIIINPYSFIKNGKYLVCILLALIVYLIYTFNNSSIYKKIYDYFTTIDNEIIPESKDTLAINVFSNEHGKSRLIFEPQDIIYYQENNIPLQHQSLQYSSKSIKNKDFDERNVNNDYIFDIDFLQDQDFIIERDYLNQRFNDQSNQRVNDRINPILNFSDTQSVHDTMVQRSVRKIFSESKNNDNDNNEIISEIINESKDHKDFLKIKKTIEKIKSRNSNVTNIDRTEMQVLIDIWEKAKKDDNIKNFLFTQLSDCVENGDVVCPTGISTRLAMSLVLNNPENFPKTDEMINMEMMNTASKMQNEYSDQDNEAFKKELISKYIKDYKGILTEQEINDRIEPWINHI